MSTQSQINSKKPIIIEFTYDEWKRLERLSNRDGRWIFKFYDAILAKAQLISLEEVKKKSDEPFDNTHVTLGERAYRKFESIYEQKVPKRFLGMESLQYAPCQTINDIDENSILIYPEALNLKHWEPHVFR